LPLRILRDRQATLSDALDAVPQRLPLSVSRRLVQVFDGGSMPTEPDHFFLAHPVELDGPEAEGGSASPVVDTSTTMYVDVLWHAPEAGDILTAYAVGGRWVAERSRPGPSEFVCGTCSIPSRDLTVSWTNDTLGDGSTTLVFSAPNVWKSGCVDNVFYRLLCTDNEVEFQVVYFLSGSCPSGESQYCSTIRSSPFRLVQTGLTCGDPFLLTCSCGVACPDLAVNGYTSFTVSS
jgi:hypothetical protein